MKILCVIDNLSTGGAQRQIINLAIGLHRRGYQVSVFCYAPGDLLAQHLRENGISIFVRLKKSRFSVDVIQALRHILDQENYQVVISFLNTPNFYAILASRFSQARPKVLVSERSVDLPGSTTLIERIVRLFYAAADRLVFNSHHQRLTFTRKYPWLRGKLSTIYNGFDLQEFTAAKREPLNKPLRLLVIASVSHLKNGLCLIRALDILKREYGMTPKVDWVGERVLHGTRLEYLREMESEIANYGLSAQWNWLDQRTDILTQLHNHDALVHPSYGEGLPNVVCEALASGRPVILSDTLDHPKLVQDGVSGYLFDWQNPADLASCIIKLDELSAEQRLAMGKRGRAFAEQYLSIERMTDSYEALFRSLI